MFADGHLLTQLDSLKRCFENLMILLTWIWIDQNLWIRIQSIRIQITALPFVTLITDFSSLVPIVSF